MEMTKSGVEFSPKELAANLPLFEVIFPDGSPLSLKRKALNQKIREEDETGIMDGTSSLIPELESFSCRIKDEIRKKAITKIDEKDFIFFALNVSEQQLERVNG